MSWFTYLRTCQELRHFLSAEKPLCFHFLNPFLFFVHAFSLFQLDQIALAISMLSGFCYHPSGSTSWYCRSGERNFISKNGVALFIVHSLPSLTYEIKFRYFWQIFLRMMWMTGLKWGLLPTVFLIAACFSRLASPGFLLNDKITSEIVGVRPNMYVAKVAV